MNKEIIKDSPISPCKYILDLFAQNMIHVLRPTKYDYEELVRRLVTSGNYIGLGILLLSPILDFFTINIYARNEKGENALDLLNSCKDNEKLRNCYTALTLYKEPSPEDIPPITEWIKIHANRFLPYFNTRNALQLTLTAATLFSAATLYLNSSSNGNTSRPTMNT